MFVSIFVQTYSMQFNEIEQGYRIEKEQLH